MQSIGAHGVNVMYFVSFCFRGELGFLNCEAICMCVVYKFFEFVFNLDYVDLQYNEDLSHSRCWICVLVSCV